MNMESGSIRVLHVDDNPDFVDVAATFLEREHDRLTVKATTSVNEALEYLAAEPVDCIVSDYEMPGQDGLEFLETVREEYGSLPFILYTGQGSEEVASEAFSAGANDYLQKEMGPDHYTVLANRITTVVEKTRTQRRHERHLKAIETADEGIAIFDSDGYCRYANERYGDIYGSEPANLHGKHWEEFYPAEEIPYVYDEIIPAVDDDGYWHGQTTNLDTNGETVEVDHTVTATDDGGLICTVQTIADQSKLEQQLTRYETIVETLNDPVYICDENGRFQYVNDAFVDLVGYDRERIVGAHAQLLKDEEMVAKVERNLSQLLSADGPDSVTFEVEIQPQDGDTIPCEDHMGVLPYDGPQFQGSVGVLRAISRRKQRDQALTQAREEYRTLFNGMNDAAWVLDTNAEILAVNDVAVERTGYTREELLSMRPHDIDAGLDEQKITALVEDMPDDGVQVFETVRETKDGEQIAVEISSSLITYQGETAILSIGRDISERKQREEQLEQFASVVSHDLRNPLNVAEGRLELARQECDSEHLDGIANAHERMHALIEDLLTLAREGKTVGDIEPINLTRLTERCWANVATAEATLTTDTAQRIRADQSRLKQLIENLVRNAIEHGGEDVTVRLGTAADGFYIEDDGPGIPKDERDNIFEAGYSTAADGTGFGLSIVEQVAQAHDWDIHVTESPDGGARFEITGVEFAAVSSTKR